MCPDHFLKSDDLRVASRQIVMNSPSSPTESGNCTVKMSTPFILQLPPHPNRKLRLLFALPEPVGQNIFEDQIGRTY